MLPDDVAAELLRQHREYRLRLADETMRRINLLRESIEDTAEFVSAAISILESAKAVSVESTSAMLSTLVEAPIVAAAPARVAVVIPDLSAPSRYAAQAGEDAGQAMLEGIVRHYLARTSRATGDAWATTADVKVTGWRRVLVGPSCSWCALVATQRYRSAESADFGHHHCNCGTAPLVDDGPPNEALYRTLNETDPTLSTRITRSKAARRHSATAESAAIERDALLAKLNVTTDPDERRKLRVKARTADETATSERAKAATAATRDISLPGGVTGYVDPSGMPTDRPR